MYDYLHTVLQGAEIIGNRAKKNNCKDYWTMARIQLIHEPIFSLVPRTTTDNLVYVIQ